MITPDYPNRRTGHYLGTEIEKKWWKRYKADKFFARGNGEYWFDNVAFYFHRYLTKYPIEIPLGKIIELEIGKSHAGRLLFRQRLLKLMWEKDGMILSSGFIVAKNQQETEIVMADLQRLLN
jgi:hypothetical protein